MYVCVHVICWGETESTWYVRHLLALLYQPQMTDKYGAFGGMRNGKGNQSTLRKPAPVPFCSAQISYDLMGSNPGCHIWKPATNHLSCDMAL
jgi:hypothetical protein